MDFKLMKKNKRANTTPETVLLTKKIKQAVDSKAEAMTMEVSSHGLALGRLEGRI